MFFILGLERLKISMIEIDILQPNRGLLLFYFHSCGSLNPTYISSKIGLKQCSPYLRIMNQGAPITYFYKSPS